MASHTDTRIIFHLCRRDPDVTWIDAGTTLISPSVFTSGFHTRLQWTLVSFPTKSIYRACVIAYMTTHDFGTEITPLHSHDECLLFSSPKDFLNFANTYISSGIDTFALLGKFPKPVLLTIIEDTKSSLLKSLCTSRLTEIDVVTPATVKDEEEQ